MISADQCSLPPLSPILHFSISIFHSSFPSLHPRSSSSFFPLLHPPPAALRVPRFPSESPESSESRILLLPKKQKTRGSCEPRASCMIPAITYFRAGRHYHRPRELNCRVRNGNECDLLGKVTGNSPARQPVSRPHSLAVFTKGSGKTALFSSSLLETGRSHSRICLATDFDQCGQAFVR